MPATPDYTGYDPNQLAWIAALNGKTPEQFINDGYVAQNGTPEQNWIDNGISGNGLTDALWKQQQQDDADQARITANVNGANGLLAGLYPGYDSITQNATDRGNYIQGLNGGLANQISGAASDANGMRTGALGAYGSAVSNAGAWDMSNFNSLVGAANAPMQMSASPYVGDAMSDPGDVARELGSYNQLEGIANGSLDQVSQAAHAYANAQDVANQRNAADTLAAAGGGALNVDLNSIRELDKLRDPTTIEGMADLRNVFGGSQDVHVGQEDPEAYAAEKDALNQLKGLTTPQVTAQEKLMYELSRQQQEQDEYATRAALEQDAARRGVTGQGTNIARAALAAQQTSRNRMLQDMQANAQAQARAMDALNGYGNLSTNMTAQANQVAEQNQATRVGALNQYTGISANAANILGQLGAANATNNANRQLAAQEAAYDAYATLRAQGFSEEYARGQAADAMANANANRQLAGAQGAADVAVNMRGQSDAMSRFNQSQRQQQQQFSDEYTANRQDAQFGRATTVFNAGNTVGRNYMQDQGNLFNATTGVADSNFNTTNSAIGTQMGLNGQWLGAQQFADTTGIQGLQGKQGIIQTQLGNNFGLVGANQTFGTNAVQRQTDLHNIGVEKSDNTAEAGEIGGFTPQPVTTNGGIAPQSTYVPISFTYGNYGI